MAGGGQLKSFRCGDRSELLAEFLLSAIAFTSRVPRQEDVGYDFFCSLIQEDDKLLKTGAFFAVQAKSSSDPVIYKKDYEIDWITNQENPLLLCVVNREALAMDIYSTWNLLGHLLKKASQIELIPRARVEPWPGVEYKEEDGAQKIGLGPPIARISATQVFDNDYIAQVKTVIGEWVALDRENIVNRQAGMYWMVGPPKYQTSQSPYDNAPMRIISTAIPAICRSAC
jgi:hypothetical protein